MFYNWCSQPGTNLIEELATNTFLKRAADAGKDKCLALKFNTTASESTQLVHANCSITSAKFICDNKCETALCPADCQKDVFLITS